MFLNDTSNGYMHHTTGNTQPPLIIKIRFEQWRLHPHLISNHKHPRELLHMKMQVVGNKGEDRGTKDWTKRSSITLAWPWSMSPAWSWSWGLTMIMVMIMSQNGAYDSKENNDKSNFLHLHYNTQMNWDYGRVAL